jgi:hypothetical protein
MCGLIGPKKPKHLHTYLDLLVDELHDLYYGDVYALDPEADYMVTIYKRL